MTYIGIVIYQGNILTITGENNKTRFFEDKELCNACVSAFSSDPNVSHVFVVTYEDYLKIVNGEVKGEEILKLAVA